MRVHLGISMPMHEFLLIILVLVAVVAVGALVVRARVGER